MEEALRTPEDKSNLYITNNISNKTIDQIYSQATLIALIIYIWYYCRYKQYYTKQETLAIAVKTEARSHLLRTNTGRLYQDSFLRHAVETFANDTRNPELINRLWIKSPPCLRCSSIIVNLYKTSSNRATLYIGETINNEDYKEGLKLLIKNGFKLKVWTRLQLELSQDVRESKRYLRRLRQEVKREAAEIHKQSCNIL